MVLGKVIDGQPSEEICKYAYKKKMDLIVMGFTGTSGLKEFFIGSEGL